METASAYSQGIGTTSLGIRSEALFAYGWCAIRAKGPATKALYGIGVEYGDIPYLAWAYHQEVPMTGFGWGHAAEVAPPLPWATREEVQRRNEEINRLWQQQQQPPHLSNAS